MSDFKNVGVINRAIETYKNTANSSLGVAEYGTFISDEFGNPYYINYFEPIDRTINTPRQKYKYERTCKGSKN